MKCSHFLHALVAIVLSSCATQKGLVGNARPPETVALSIDPDPAPTPPPSGRAPASVPNVVAGEIAVAVGKYLVNKAGAAVEQYATQFEGKYQASEVLDLMSNGFTRLRGKFIRTVHFKDMKSARVACAGYQIDDDQIKPSAKGYDVVAMEFHFIVEPAKQGKSMRFKPMKLIYRAPKAHRLAKGLKDDPKLSLAFLVSEAVQGVDPVTHAAATTPISITPSSKDQKDMYEAELSSSWIAMPLSGAFTIEVKALETGKGKEKLESLAKLLREWGGKAVDAAAAR